ncbi:2-hexaprenyl-6-methoxy-1,4-benzoquinone methyltransferase, partial [Perkinsus olseni]
MTSTAFSCLRFCWVVALLVPLALVLLNVILDQSFDRTAGQQQKVADGSRQAFGSGKMFDRIAQYYDMGN